MEDFHSEESGASDDYVEMEKVVGRTHQSSEVDHIYNH